MLDSDLVHLAGVIGSVLLLIGGAIWWCLKRYLNKLHREIKALKARNAKNAKFEDGNDQLRFEKAGLESDISHLHKDVKRLTEDGEDLRRQVQQDAETLSRFRAENAELRGKHSVLEEQRARLNVQLTEQVGALESVRRERDRFRVEAETVTHQLSQVRAEIAGGKQRLERAEQRAKELEQELDDRVERHQRDVEAHLKQIAQLTGERDRENNRARQAEAGADQLTAQLEQLNKQLELVIKQDERVWERPVAGPLFQPLPQREVPIISVLNLKGGVGKTTLTANLAGLLAQQGKKVLVIDADYQRNLSMLLVSDNDRKMLHLERRTLQQFLKSPSRSLPSLLSAASEVSGVPDCWVVTNSDSPMAPLAASAPVLDDFGLEDVEMRLMAEWMFRRTGPDVRLHLREALHDPGLKEKGYRYVLIDCPPRLSTACINALAASDFFLIPVLLDAVSARSVPNLLRTLRRLRATAFPHLSCLGIVANEVTLRGGQLIAREAATWQELPVLCRVIWGSNVHLFRTMVPDSGRIAEAAGHVFGQGAGPRLALGEPEINRFFTALLKEIKTRIDHESKQLATVSA